MRTSCIFFVALTIAFTTCSIARAETACEVSLSQAGSATHGNAVGRAIDRFLYSVFGLGDAPRGQIEVRDEELAGSPLALAMLKLAREGVLLSQTDDRLKKMNLVIANGGLCASACVTNIAGAVTEVNLADHDFKNSSATVLALLVATYPIAIEIDPRFNAFKIPEPRSGEDPLMTLLRPLLAQAASRFSDARTGALTDVLLKIMGPYLEKLGAHVHLDQAADLETLIERSGTNSIMVIAGASIRDRITGASPQVHARHALILLKYLPASNEVLISDPNEPNKIYRELLRSDEHGLYFNTRVNYTPNGSRAYLDRVHIIEQ